MPYLNVGQENSSPVEIYYEDHGVGQPVVLIHGWPLSSASWEKQVAPLLAAGYRVVRYDRRGFGRSSQPSIGYDYDTLANDLRQLLEHLDLHRAALVGFSMGGGEVARYLGQFGAARIAQAAFIAAVPPYLRKEDDNPDGVDSVIFDEIRKSLAIDRPAYLTKFFADFYNIDLLQPKRISAEVLHASWSVATGASPIGTDACVPSWGTDFRDDLRLIEVPTLVVHGDADRILPITATAARMREFIPHARLVTIPGAPHGLNWTHAEDLNRELLGFLTQTAKAPAELAAHTI